MHIRLKSIIRFLLPYILIVILGIAGTGLLTASEGVHGSPYVNQPGNISPIDEGEQLEWAYRVLHGQVPYRDFWMLYTPLRSYLIAGSMMLFGQSIFVERVYFAALPLLGFIALFALLRYLTRNTYLSIIVTMLAISSHSIGERNSVFIMAMYAFVRSLSGIGEAGLPKKFRVNGRLLLIAGLLSALSFWMSQEFGIYAFIGSAASLCVLWCINKTPVRQIFIHSKAYIAGLLIGILPYTGYLVIQGAFPSFVRFVFTDFSTGPIATLWSEPLPSLFILPADRWFTPGGYLYMPTIQSYALIAVLVITMAFSLIYVWKHKHATSLWPVIIITMFGLPNLRGLLYSQSADRRAGLYVFLFLVVALYMYILPKIRNTLVPFGYILIVCAVTFFSWYAVSISSLNTYGNELADLLSLRHRPQGILLDQPRVNIRMYPTTIDNAYGKYMEIVPNESRVKDLMQVLQIDASLKHSMQTDYDASFRSLGDMIRSVNLTESRIARHDMTLQNQLERITHTSADLSDTTNFALTNIRAYVQTEKQYRDTLWQDSSSDDGAWFQTQKQLKAASEVLSILEQLNQYYAYIESNVTMAVMQQDVQAVSADLQNAAFLATGSATYAYGYPLPSVALFIADRLNPTKFSPMLSNISLSQQSEMIKDLSLHIPCHLIQWRTFGDKTFTTTEYLPRLVQFIDGEFKPAYGLHSSQMELSSCRTEHLSQ